MQTLIEALDEWKEAQEETNEQRADALRREIGQRMQALAGHQIGHLRDQVSQVQFDQAIEALSNQTKTS